MEYFKSLPADVTVDILTRLPTEWVIECKLVSKSWCNLISHHPSFSKLHLDHLNHPFNADSAGKLSYVASTGSRFGDFYYFEYNKNHEAKPIGGIRRMNLIYDSSSWTDVTFVGSCNGIICLARSPYLQEETFICNPITREYVRLPRIKMTGYVYWTNGFGYVSLTNEYKVVRIMLTDKYKGVKTKFVEARIYTLGSGNGWRKLGELKIEKTGSWEQGVFANGAIYWKDIESGKITTFDLAEEKFCESLSPPPLPQGSNWGDHKIGALDGFLFFAVYLDVEGAYCFDIWLLKKKNDDHDKKEGDGHQSVGWSKVFRVDCSRVLAVTKGDGVLTYKNDFFGRNRGSINIYDKAASTSKRLVDFKECIREVIPHKNTLVSLKELGEDDAQIMESTDFAGDKATITVL